MRIGCLQFAPVQGDVNNNLSRADAVLLKEGSGDLDKLDILVLPELAFSGYYFKSLQEIFPHLEPTGSGISSLWARTVALKYGCTVIVGYPEKVDVSDRWPASPEYYNSALIVNSDGETIGGYRKNHLYSVDETWALEGQDGFFCGEIAGVDNTVLGISMDLAPYRFRSPETAYEFAFHTLNVESNLVIVSLAWPTSQDSQLFSRSPQEPDMESLMYWISRLGPLIHKESEEETIVVFANRTGSEDGIVYAGTSAVLGIREGEVNVYGILGRSEKELLIVDTDKEPYGKLVYRPEGVSMGEKSFYSQGHKAENETDRQPPSPPVPPPAPPAAPPRQSDAVKSRQDSPSVSSRAVAQRELVAVEKSHKKARETPKLSLDTGPNVTETPVFPNIPTPTGPSPTPISRRPRFSIPPAESWTKRYLDNHHFVPTPHPNVYTPAIGSARILGGEVIIASAASVDEQGQHFNWDIGNASTRTEHSPTHSDSTNFSGLSSVHTGRGGAPNGPYQKLEPSRGSNAGTRLATFAEVEEPVEVLPQPKTMEQLTADYAKLQMEEMKKRRLVSNRGLPQRTPTNEHPIDRPSSSRGVTRQPQYKHSPKARPASPASSLENNAPSEKSYSGSSTGSGQRRDTADFQRGRADSEQGRGISSGGARSSPMPKRPSTSSTSADRFRDENRGRPRQARPDDRAQIGASATPDTQRQSKREDSGRRSAKAPDPVDLSQFQVIEEYPAENCPVHGSRSNSRSHDQSSRPPSSKPPRHRSISARGQQTNVRMAAVKSNLPKGQPGVRKPNGPVLARKKSDISLSVAARPHSALEMRQSILSSADERKQLTAVNTLLPARSASTLPFSHSREGLQNSWADKRLEMLSQSVPPITPPPRETDSRIVIKEPTTPQAMLIMYDPVEGDKDNAGLAGQALHCVAKTPTPRVVG